MGDKWGGSLAGLRLPTAAGEQHPTTSSLDVAATSSFEEALTLEGGGLLRARLSGEGACIVWEPVPADRIAAEHARVVAQSQMTGMLLDAPRNRAYAAAIARTVEQFVAMEHRRPVVLDIGAGSGLLSLFAASAGATVVGCEQWGIMCGVARQVVAANPSLAPSISLLTCHSSDLTVGEGGHLPATGADIVVSEILDSALIGEGVIPALRDAFARLLRSQAASAAAPRNSSSEVAPPAPRVVPHGARMFGQLVHCPTLTRWQDGRACDVPCAAGGGGGVLGGEASVPLRRTDWGADCAVASSPIPVHFAALQPYCRPVTRPFQLFAIDFTPEGLRTWDTATAAAPIGLLVEALPLGPGLEGAGATGLLMWWDCDIGGLSERYTTQPHWAREEEGEGGCSSAPAPCPPQPWQDHWVQVVVPFTCPVSPLPPGPGSPPCFTVAASLSDLRIHTVVGGGNCAVWPSKRAHKLHGKQRPSSDATALAASAGNPLYLEPALCTCGLHRTCGYERRWMLGSTSWGRAVSRAVACVLRAGPGGRGRAEGEGGAPHCAAEANNAMGAGVGGLRAPHGVLTLGEGGLCAASACASLSSVCAATPGKEDGRPALWVVAVEAEAEGATQTRTVLEAAAASCGAAVEAVTVLQLDPLQPLLLALTAALQEQRGAEDQLEGEEEEGEGVQLGDREEDRLHGVSDTGDGELFAVGEEGAAVEAEAVAIEGEEDEVMRTGHPGDGDCATAGGPDVVSPTTPAAPSPSAPLFRTLLIEPFYATLASVPIVAMVHALTQRWAVQPLLQPGAAILPLRARVMVQAVHLSRLWGAHGPVGQVSGFNHAPYDGVVAGWADHVYSFPMWQYAGGTTHLSAPAAALEIDFCAAPPPSGPSRDQLLRGCVHLPVPLQQQRLPPAECQSAEPHTCHAQSSNAEAESAAPAPRLLSVNAILAWVEYDLTDEIRISTGVDLALGGGGAPSGSGGNSAPAALEGGHRQHVKFLQLPITFPAVTQLSMRVEVDLSGLLLGFGTAAGTEGPPGAGGAVGAAAAGSGGAGIVLRASRSGEERK